MESHKRISTKRVKAMLNKGVSCILLVFLIITGGVKQGMASEKDASDSGKSVLFTVPNDKVQLESDDLGEDVIQQGKWLSYTVDYQMSDNLSNTDQISEDKKATVEATALYLEVRLPLQKNQAAFELDETALEKSGFEIIKNEDYYDNEDAATQTVESSAIEVMTESETETSSEETTDSSATKSSESTTSSSTSEEERPRPDETEETPLGQRLLLKREAKLGESGSFSIKIRTKKTDNDYQISPWFEVRTTEEIVVAKENDAAITSFITGKTITAKATTESGRAELVSRALTTFGLLAATNIPTGTVTAGEFVNATALVIRPLDESDIQPVTIVGSTTAVETTRVTEVQPAFNTNSGQSTRLSYLYSDWKKYQYIDIGYSTVVNAYTVSNPGAVTIGFPDIKKQSLNSTGYQEPDAQTGSVTARYPVVGYYQGEKVGCIAEYTVTYFPSSAASTPDNPRNFDTSTRHPVIQIGDMLYKGVAISNVEDLKVKYNFFLSDDNAGKSFEDIEYIDLQDSFYTIHSLNYEYSMTSGTNDGYFNSEGASFYSDDGVITTVTPADTNLKTEPNSAGVFATAIDNSTSGSVLRPFRQVIGYRYYWGASDNGFNDYIGSATYYKNSVTAYQGGSYSFAVDTPKWMARMWWSISSGSIATQKPEEPKKTVSTTGDEGTFGTTNDAEYGDKITYRVDQKVNYLGVDASLRYYALSITDTIPIGMVIDTGSIKLYRIVDGGTPELVTGAGTAAFADGNRTVVFTFNSTYLENMLMKGETYRLEFKATITSPADPSDKVDKEFENYATVTFRGNSSGNANSIYSPRTNVTTTYVKVAPMTVAFAFKKVSAQNLDKVLPGAEFKLYKKICDDTIQHNHETLVPYDFVFESGASNCWELILFNSTEDHMTSDNDGVVNLGELGKNTYMLVETKAPIDSVDGKVYEIPMGQWKLTVNPETAEDKIKIEGVAAATGYNRVPPAFAISQEQNQETGETTSVYKLPNMKQFSIPMAGNIGKWPFLLGGSALTVFCFAGSLLLGRRKKLKKKGKA